MTPNTVGHVTITRDRVFDALSLTGAIALLIVSVVGPPENLAYTGVGIAVQVMAVGPLVFRRLAPLAVIWFTAATAIGMSITELVAPGTIIDLAHDHGTLWIPQAVTPFAVCGAMSHYRNQTAVWIPTGVLFILGLRPWELTGARIAQSLILVIVPAVIGMSIAARDRTYKVLMESARADERAKLAAEMHDVVTHRVSLMVLQAGGLEMTARDEETRRAAEELRANGCQALEELREVVAILREQGGESTGKTAQAPVPELSTLVSESTSVGVPVELVEEGAAGQASAVVRRTAHRIVQEALTNVRKHAPGAKVRVHVTYGPSDTRVSVRNSPPIGPGLSLAGSGSGLDNLRERVSMIGGTLDAGPSSEGGFHVSATLTEPVS
ncbi:Signal transduction histidine kinase [Kibdelosporangium aridum]|uniref:histidine kinase n=1 Tax=Kibdelosporangium aridum TaxID=2030 RepID=A0A1Y5XV34_KIBAR|nr:Signal transduction histidine kinase [Kibdelosporangium aridum]